MNLLDLPLEMVEDIMEWVAYDHSQDHKHVRFVCRCFDHAFMRAAFRGPHSIRINRWVMELNGALYITNKILREWKDDDNGSIVSNIRRTVDRALRIGGTVEEGSVYDRRRKYTSALSSGLIDSYGPKGLDYLALLINFSDYAKLEPNPDGPIEPFTAALLVGNTYFAKDMIGSVSDFNAETRYFGKPLSAAAYRGDFELVRLLVDRGAKVSKVDGTKLSPLSAAAINGDENIVRFFLKPEFGLGRADFMKAIELAAKHGSSKALGHLLKAGGQNYSRQFLRGVLRKASSGGHEGAVGQVLDYVTSGPFRAIIGHEAMLTAVAHGRVSVVRELVTRSIWVPDTRTSPASLALSEAARIGYICVARAALDLGAIINTWHFNPLMTAARYHHARMVRFLLDNGATLTIDSALHTMRNTMMSLDSSTESFRVLVTYGGFDPAIYFNVRPTVQPTKTETKAETNTKKKKKKAKKWIPICGVGEFCNGPATLARN
ncbi:hypothetical protein FQN54_009768 [Arachnomyces sp. PD_36]|nr:hypothetical protein FQN54_009768 [Arachnomyces sp. PD_36]